jgi:hypothetical protein
LTIRLQVAFLFSDTQIKDESFVEDLSNLINTYEVPNLLGSGDLAGIFENIRPRAKQANVDGNKDSLYNFFLQEVREGVAPDGQTCCSTPAKTAGFSPGNQRPSSNARRTSCRVCTCHYCEGSMRQQGEAHDGHGHILSQGHSVTC